MRLKHTISDLRSFWAEQQNREDLSRLLLLSVLIPLIWVVFLGWNLQDSLANLDFTAWFIPTLKSYFDLGGDWTQNLYRSTVFGGVKVHDKAGTLPIVELFSILGLNPVVAANLVVLFFQVGFSFFGIRTAIDLCHFWKACESETENEHLSVAMPIQLVLAVLLAFAPFLAWRIFYGHTVFMISFFPLIAGMALMVSGIAGRLNSVLICIAFAYLANAFPNNGQQAIVYGFFFGSPVLLSLVNRAQIRASFVIPLLVVLAALMFSAPKLAGMFHNITSGDSTRSLGEAVTYSYSTATASDMISSLTLGKELIPSGRPEHELHDTNIPFGPLLLVFFLAPIALAWKVLVGLGASLLMAITFAMNLAPISSLMLAAFPPLENFRVPTRSLLVFTLSALPVFVASLLYRFPFLSNLSGRSGLIALVLGSFVLFFPPFGTEAILLVSSMGLIFVSRIEQFRKLDFIAPILISVIVFSSLSGFKSRHFPFASAEKTFSLTEKMGKEILRLQPRLHSSLTRARLNFVMNGIDRNTGLLMGIPTLDGYGFPPKRLLQLYSSINQIPFSPTIAVINFPESMKFFPIFAQLYNICCQFDLENGNIKYRPIPKSAGEAWLSKDSIILDSIEAVTNRLRENQFSLAEVTKKSQWINRSDTAFRQTKPRAISGCIGTVTNTSAQSIGQTITVEVSAQTTCPLTISTNFASNLNARLEDGSELATYPAYGSLLGVTIPPGKHKVIVEPRANQPLWSLILFALGIATLLVILVNKTGWLNRYDR